MDDISKILSNKTVKAPKEIDLLKKFIKNKYDEDIKVTVKNNAFLIEVSKSALANAIRYDFSEIRKKITDKKIIIRTTR
jgi:hypothetical protein